MEGDHFGGKNFITLSNVDVGGQESDDDVAHKDEIDEQVDACKRDVAVNHCRSIKANRERRPDGVPNGQDHDQVFEIIQKRACRRLNDKAARIASVLVSLQALLNLLLNLADVVFVIHLLLIFVVDLVD